jgi:membrane carboxypeptidase/penicillin-binding protein
MKTAHKNLPVKDFEIPSEIVFRIVCLESGELATEKCPKIIKDVFTEKTEPKNFCHIHKGKSLPEDLDIPKFKEIERKPEKSKRIYF